MKVWLMLTCVFLVLPTVAQGQIILNFSSSFPEELKDEAVSTVDLFSNWLKKQEQEVVLDDPIWFVSRNEAKQFLEEKLGVEIDEQSAKFVSGMVRCDRGAVVVASSFLQWSIVHELFHILECSLAGDMDVAFSIYFLAEGAADLAAYHLLGGILPPLAYDGQSSRLLGGSIFLVPRQLMTEEGWVEAMGKYGPAVVYRMAMLFTTDLYHHGGWRQILLYFRLLKDKPEEAFRRAFGVSLEEWLKKWE